MDISGAGELPPAKRSIRWSDGFEVVDAQAPVTELLRSIAARAAHYILIRRADDLLYAFTVHELRRIPGIGPLLRGVPPPGLTVEDALELHEHDSSALTGLDGVARPHPYSVPGGLFALPSRARWVALDHSGQPAAVGEDPDSPALKRDGQPRTVDLQSLKRHTGSMPEAVSEPEAVKGARPIPRMRGGRRRSRAAPPPAPGDRSAAAPPPPPAPASRAPVHPADGVDGGDVRTDEGTDPVRFPSITADRILAAGEPVTITVDLRRGQIDPETVGGPVGFADLPADWQSLEVTVDITCTAITFEETTRSIEVLRNADSVPAVFNGVVAADARSATPIPVFAAFQFADRICGMAQRTFTLGQAEPLQPENAAGPAPFVVETKVEPPALTVKIIKPDPSEPGKLIWTLKVPRPDRVPGLPGRLTQAIDIGRDPASYAADVYQRFSDVLARNHVDLFHAVGDELWDQTPAMFRKAYWALRAALGTDFTIQFITDDPHIPWELMRPADDDAGELAEILALAHPVARWIGDYEGYLRQNLPAGRIVTIAPIYPSVMDELPRAQEEADLLTGDYHAARVPGTVAEVKELLRTGTPDGHVAILHFAGHGEFPPGGPSHATIKLEDGSLAARVVGARETRLGERDGPLVVFNACKVGCTGETLGASGGWADVFLKRRFSGFIAPLWPVYDTEAAAIIEAFFKRVARQREPVGKVLQQIRAEHADASPTFFAYLYFGDVNARLAAPIA